MFYSELILVLSEVLLSLWWDTICRPWWDVQAVSLHMIIPCCQTRSYVVCIWLTTELMVQIWSFTFSLCILCQDHSWPRMALDLLIFSNVRILHCFWLHVINLVGIWCSANAGSANAGSIMASAVGGMEMCHQKLPIYIFCCQMHSDMSSSPTDSRIWTQHHAGMVNRPAPCCCSMHNSLELAIMV